MEADLLPSDEMIDEGLQQLREAAAESGADAVKNVFGWLVVEEQRISISGFESVSVTPRGIVLQGIAVRYAQN